MAGRFSVEAVFKAVDRITAPVTRMQNRVGKFTRSMTRGLRTVNRQLDKVVGGMARAGKSAVKFAAIGLGVVTGAVTLLIREFSKIEDAEAAFTPLLGGAKKAKEMVEALNKTAASTPFQFENLAAAANQLLPVMNGNIEDTIKTLRMLGDTAGGNAQKLDTITRGFTKAMLKGKVDMESLNMIAEAGVPIFGDLAEVMGVEVDAAFFKMISAGKVATKDLTKAFEKMTSSGGIFFGGMEIASKTTSGLWSTLKDNISLTAAELGGVLAPVVKDLIRGATDIARKVRIWVKNNRELISAKFTEFVEGAKNAIKKMIKAIKNLNDENSVFERLKAFVSAVTSAIIFLGRHGKTIAKIIAAIVALSLVLKTLSIVMTVVNIVMAANPIGLIVIAIAAMIAAVAAAIIWWDELKAMFMGLPAPVKAAIAVIMGPISLLIGAAVLVMDAWEPLTGFFGGLWDGVVDGFKNAFKFITNITDKIMNKIQPIIDFHKFGFDAAASMLGFGDDNDKPTSQVVSPGDRVARSIEEHRTTSTAEVTIRDESGRAEVTGGTLGPGLSLQSSGAF